jgi:hypothetical protein
VRNTEGETRRGGEGAKKEEGETKRGGEGEKQNVEERCCA